MSLPEQGCSAMSKEVLGKCSLTPVRVGTHTPGDPEALGLTQDSQSVNPNP